MDHEQFTVPYFQGSTMPQFQLVPFSSEQHLETETKHRRCIDAMAADLGQYGSGSDADLVFLGPSDDL